MVLAPKELAPLPSVIHYLKILRSDSFKALTYFSTIVSTTTPFSCSSFNNLNMGFFSIQPKFFQLPTLQQAMHFNQT
jgi:hypothetical protein